MLYREPKLLKDVPDAVVYGPSRVSVLYREPKLLKAGSAVTTVVIDEVSVLYREPKLLKEIVRVVMEAERQAVSVLYREPKLLKGLFALADTATNAAFQCSTVSRNC